MKLAGDYLFDASVQDVWDALFDPEVLAAAMPGCEKLELVDGDFVGEMTIKVGPISGKFTGKVRLEDKDEPRRYKMIVDGRGAPGFVKATATIALAPEGTSTRLTYDADAQIGGKIASVGERLVDASARAITKQSLDGLHENIKIRAAHHAATNATPEQGAASASSTTGASTTGSSIGEASTSHAPTTGSSPSGSSMGEASTSPTPTSGTPSGSSPTGSSTGGASTTGASTTGASTAGASPSGSSAIGSSTTGASTTGSSTTGASTSSAPTSGASSTAGASASGSSTSGSTGAATTGASTSATSAGPVYKRADAGQMAKAVAAATFKTMLPVIVAIAVGVAIVVWLIIR